MLASEAYSIAKPIEAMVTIEKYLLTLSAEDRISIKLKLDNALSSISEEAKKGGMCLYIPLINTTQEHDHYIGTDKNLVIILRDLGYQVTHNPTLVSTRIDPIYTNAIVRKYEYKEIFVTWRKNF